MSRRNLRKQRRRAFQPLSLDYFVDPLLGDDANDGLSADTALRTFKELATRPPAIVRAPLIVNLMANIGHGRLVRRDAPITIHHITSKDRPGGVETFHDVPRLTLPDLVRHFHPEPGWSLRPEGA